MIQQISNIMILFQVSILLVVLMSQSRTEVTAQQTQNTSISSNNNDIVKQHSTSQRDRSIPTISDINTNGLDPKIGDHHYVKEIIERLHALDADIGKLLYNTTSMYSPNDQAIAQNEPKGGEKFTEVLNDLDSLQDEIGGLVSNATKSRQYNMVVRLRPLNSILYRIRHNLHLMRNSLVAINTVAGLEKLGNSVLDSTLEAFMRPDADLNEEIGDNGNYDINLDKPEQPTAIVSGPNPVRSSPSTTPSTTTTSTTTKMTTKTTTTTTTTTTTPAPTTASTTKAPTTSPSSGRRNQRPQTRRPQNNRRTSTTTTTTTQKPINSTLAMG